MGCPVFRLLRGRVVSPGVPILASINAPGPYGSYNFTLSTVYSPEVNVLTLDKLKRYEHTEQLGLDIRQQQRHNVRQQHGVDIGIELRHELGQQQC